MKSLPFYSHAAAATLAEILEGEGRRVSVRKIAGRWHVVEV